MVLYVTHLAGPSVLEVFNSLLRHLRVSVEYTANSEQEQTDNTRFQESIINTIGTSAQLYVCLSVRILICPSVNIYSKGFFF